MQLFYTPNITLPVYELPEEESAHSIRVLRLSRGDTLHMTDGRGNLYAARIVSADPKRTTVRIIENIPRFEKRDYNLTIAAAPTKNIDRFEWFLEKATETGVDRIIPMECDHSERRTIHRDRLLRVVTSAVKQSLKAYHPVLDEITPLGDVIDSTVTDDACSGSSASGGVSKLDGLTLSEGAGFTGKKLIAHCREGRREFIGDVLSKGDDALILIGPEGDFSDREIATALEAGFVPVTFGTSRLRTETAALAAATIVSYINNM